MSRTKSGKASRALVNEILEIAARDVSVRRANISIDPRLAASLAEAVRRSEKKSLLIALDKAIELLGLPLEYNDADRAHVLATSLGRRLESFGLKVGTAESGLYLRFVLA